MNRFVWPGRSGRPLADRGGILGAGTWCTDNGSSDEPRHYN